MISLLDESKIFILVLIIFVSIDLPMILFINKNMYEKTFKKINKRGKVAPHRIYVSAIFIYLLLAFALYYFSVKQDNVINAAVIGLIIYGVYNLTNYATIKKYGLKQTLIDMAWGTFLCTTVAYLAILINKKFLTSASTTSGIASNVTSKLLSGLNSDVEPSAPIKPSTSFKPEPDASMNTTTDTSVNN
jgi:uncharacterized membrane protein